MLLNSGLILNAARQLADHAKQEAGSADPDAQIIQAWKRTFARRPNERELASARKFMVDQQQVIASSDPTRTGEDTGRIKPSDADEAFVDLCHALLNANEFLFID